MTEDLKSKKKTKKDKMQIGTLFMPVNLVILGGF